MKVLAFDCSASRGSVAVVEGSEVLFAESFDCPRGRGGEFFPALERAMKAAGRPDRVAVGIGPGSYNGLRAAISAAEGLKLATGAALVGIASVEALPCDGGEYVVVNDARGGVFCYVKIRGREIVGGIELLNADAVAERLAAETAPIFTTALIENLPQAGLGFPDAVILARLGEGAKPGMGVLEPIYLKPAHITKPKQSGLRPGGK
ncbi:MAG: tRNA (adenosine(37)-N6)-threonylcarbamoyltransferase complex dimerization subunit type 1 TsaB [Chthoniobacterales bacterium]